MNQWCRSNHRERGQPTRVGLGVVVFQGFFSSLSLSLSLVPSYFVSDGGGVTDYLWIPLACFMDWLVVTRSPGNAWRLRFSVAFHCYHLAPDSPAAAQDRRYAATSTVRDPCARVWVSQLCIGRRRKDSPRQIDGRRRRQAAAAEAMATNVQEDQKNCHISTMHQVQRNIGLPRSDCSETSSHSIKCPCKSGRESDADWSADSPRGNIGDGIPASRPVQSVISRRRCTTTWNDAPDAHLGDERQHLSGWRSTCSAAARPMTDPATFFHGRWTSPPVFAMAWLWNDALDAPLVAMPWATSSWRRMMSRTDNRCRAIFFMFTYWQVLSRRATGAD